MEVNMKQMALLTSLFGVVSFVCGVIAENKKSSAGTVISGKDVVICKYSSDPYVGLGYTSVVCLILACAIGYKSMYIPYKKKAIPHNALFGTKAMIVFFNVAWMTSLLALTLLLWPTITQQIHLSNTVHKNLDYTCPTAKTGLIGGGAFVALDACLFWLVCLMLTNNAREDYFDEVEDSRMGEKTQVINVDFDPLDSR